MTPLGVDDARGPARDGARDTTSMWWRRAFSRWWRRPDRLRFAYVVVIAGAFLLTALARAGGDATGQSAHPPARAATVAVQPLPAACVVETAGVRGCNVTPAEASKYLGFTPERPAEVPPGIHLVSQDLRGIATAGTAQAPDRSTGYFQMWAPVGALPGDTGNYQQYLQLRERTVIEGDTTDCGPQFAPSGLGNGLRACVGTTATTGSATAPGASAPTANTVIIWTSHGVWHLLEGVGVSRPQLLQFAGAFPA